MTPPPSRGVNPPTSVAPGGVPKSVAHAGFPQGSDFSRDRPNCQRGVAPGSVMIPTRLAGATGCLGRGSGRLLFYVAIRGLVRSGPKNRAVDSALVVMREVAIRFALLI